MQCSHAENNTFTPQISKTTGFIGRLKVFESATLRISTSFLVHSYFQLVQNSWAGVKALETREIGEAQCRN